MKEIIELDINLIVEDPTQPRKSFDEDSLRELSASISERGVKSPISVHLDKNGHYVINHGARRYRASIMAGKDTIPAFIDDDYNLIDQVTENIQRDNLTVREIVDVMSRLRNQGLSNKDITKKFHKSKAWVSSYFALVDAPEPVVNLILDGKYTDTTMLAQLSRLYNRDADAVTEFIAVNDDIKRADVAILTDYIDKKNQAISQDVTEDYEMPVPDCKKKSLKVTKFKVRYNGELYELRNRKPSNEHLAWICDLEKKADIEVNISDIELVSSFQDDA